MSDFMGAKTSEPINTLWNSYRQMVLPENAPSVQIEECHRAFFAGAAALFETIMRVMDPGDEPSAADLSRMDAIHRELRAFGKGFDAELLGKQRGHG